MSQLVPRARPAAHGQRVAAALGQRALAVVANVQRARPALLRLAVRLMILGQVRAFGRVLERLAGLGRGDGRLKQARPFVLMIVLRAVIAFLHARVWRSRHLGTPLALRQLPPTIRRRSLIILWRVNLRGTRLTCDQEKRVLFFSFVSFETAGEGNKKEDDNRRYIINLATRH